ncbi:MAG: Rieske (2Fe-2S) protein [Gammaproteobacteria bacterium]|jgi:nitrite reductase/ring-hydroxylating ferredoxin subunit
MQNIKKKHLACSLEELKKSNCLGLEIELDGTTVECFLVYYENKVYSYLNRCPHTGINLEWMPNQFLDTANEFIQCATHGALFDIENGLCLRGPCLGDRLKNIENCLIEDNIYLIL